MTNDIPFASLVIVNWNGRLYLEDCLTSLLASDYSRYEVLFVNNNSTDVSVAFVQSTFPQVKIHRTHRNQGFAAGSNAGIRRSKGELIVLLNPDVIVRPRWLHNLAEGMFTDETVGIGGGKAYFPDGRTLQHAGGFIQAPLAIGNQYGRGEIDRGQYNRQREVDYVMGTALGVKRSVLDQIGLPDERYFLYYEEPDLCYRARRAGYRALYIPDAVLIHVEGATSSQGDYAQFHVSHTSRWRFVLKHYSVSQILNQLQGEYAHLALNLCDDERRGLSTAYETTLRTLPEILAARVRDGANLVSDEDQKKIMRALSVLRRGVWGMAGQLDGRESPITIHIPFTNKQPLWKGDQPYEHVDQR
ncbi:MAG: glycosyltransferase family 2 protein [Chloroflexota bacterium]|nr:glycosyltransferase family 2 protein [Chloroflexota bacterium]